METGKVSKHRKHFYTDHILTLPEGDESQSTDRLAGELGVYEMVEKGDMLLHGCHTSLQPKSNQKQLF